MNLRSLFHRSAPPPQPIEVGIVGWGRELDDALAESAATGKPVFALFQEVPGCAGCQQFGADVLSNPAIVDAIEEAFVPFLVHNNQQGRDAEVLALYGEPAWNYQVVRFLDSTGSDVIPRRDRVWEAGPLAARMIETLERSDRPVPAYLRLLEQEHSDRLQTVHLAQPCFWIGEAVLGQLDGVVTTEAAFLDGHEVTTVRFDPRVVDAPSLVRQAIDGDVAHRVYAEPSIRAELELAALTVTTANLADRRVAPDRDQKRQLAGVRGLGGLSPAQLTKLNALHRSDPDAARRHLPPRSRDIV